QEVERAVEPGDRLAGVALDQLDPVGDGGPGEEVARLARAGGVELQRHHAPAVELLRHGDGGIADRRAHLEHHRAHRPRQCPPSLLATSRSPAYTSTWATSLRSGPRSLMCTVEAAHWRPAGERPGRKRSAAWSRGWARHEAPLQVRRLASRRARSASIDAYAGWRSRFTSSSGSARRSYSSRCPSEYSA